MPRIVDIEERRDEVAEAAARVIARDGLASATMRAVAAEAGWTTGALTHWFADKRELLRFTLEASLDRRRAVRGDGASDEDPVEALRRALLRVLPVDEDSRRHWLVTLAFCAEATGDPELGEVQSRSYRAFRADMASLVEGAGIVGADGAEREAEHLVALADGVAIQAMFDPDSWPPERQRRAVCDGLDRALRTLPRDASLS